LRSIAAASPWIPLPLPQGRAVTHGIEGWGLSPAKNQAPTPPPPCPTEKTNNHPCITYPPHAPAKREAGGSTHRDGSASLADASGKPRRAGGRGRGAHSRASSVSAASAASDGARAAAPAAPRLLLLHQDGGEGEPGRGKFMRVCVRGCVRAWVRGEGARGGARH
jgi:hypothetical protein